MASRTPRSEALAAWLPGQRWFATKTRRITALAVDDRVPVDGGDVLIVRVTLDDGRQDRYAVPLRGDEWLADGLDSPTLCRALLALMAGGGRAPGEAGALVGSATGVFPALPAGVEVRRLAGEQSNTSVVVGETLIVKHFRRLAPGVNPELEITRFLTERTRFRHTPRLAGALEYLDGGGSATFAVAHELVPGAQDGWRWMLERLAAGEPALVPLGRLGERTAALHTALASDPGDPAFAPEPIGPGDVAGWAEAVRAQLTAAREAAGRPLPDVGTGLEGAAGLGGLVGCAKIRHHGDFHLGQTLSVAGGKDFMIIDFEGEPLRSLEERRRKHTPLRDVAGMLRSLGYAAASSALPPGERARWEEDARAAFLAGYRAAAGAAPFLPASDEAFTRALAVLEVEKAAYEVVYEANNRPDWIAIPLRGLVTASAALAGPPAAGAP